MRDVPEFLIKEYDGSVQIKHTEDAVKELMDIKNANKEIFIVFCLNTKNIIISREIVSVGILDASLIHPREIFRTAILKNSNSIIVAHNHPSGDITPSDEDKVITKLLTDAGELLKIKVLDHIIVSDAETYSFKEQGLL